MQNIDLKCLTVFHIKITQPKKGELKLGSSLSALRAATNAFAPSTCARHVYICHQSLMKDLSDSRPLRNIEMHASHFERLDGAAGYTFLLKWAIGLISNKLKSNDHFVRGQLRQSWRQYLESALTDNAKKIEPIIHILFEDATKIRAMFYDDSIDLFELKAAERNRLVHLLCENCGIMRSKQLKPIYDNLLKPIEEQLELGYLDQTKALKVSLKVLQGKIKPNDRVGLLPSLSKSSQSLMFKQFNAAIQTANSIKHVTRSLQNLKIK